MTKSGTVCGVDFDNTLVTYDAILATVVRERGLIQSASGENKTSIRDRIRRTPDGDIEWQKCQALIYGSRIDGAALIPGVKPFFQRCLAEGVHVVVISHKTEFSPMDPTHTNLRDAALRWMTNNHFFEAAGLGLKREDVYFADTREAKIERIRSLGCATFIDDLDEVFREPSFPPKTARILYQPGRNATAPEGTTLARSWEEISEFFFGSR